jgi:methyl coenzyme M reductase subunit C-like uncharacterized protein (methanogenesis marker protein 7)
MLYQLVLITNLGVVTPLATFDNRLDCIKEQGMIARSAQYSAACLPTESPKELQARIDAGIQTLVDNIGRLQERMDKK